MPSSLRFKYGVKCEPAPDIVSEGHASSLQAELAELRPVISHVGECFKPTELLRLSFSEEGRVEVVLKKVRLPQPATDDKL